MRTLAWAAFPLASALGYVLSAAPLIQGSQPYPGMLDEHPAIQYATAPVHDPMARLQADIASGTRSLAYDEHSGYLPGVLDALGVSRESQLLVFSKTGVQRNFTSPRNPRALYFNDSVVVGYIPGARVLEIAAQDRQQGIVFYTIGQTVSARAEIVRRTGQCLSCHVSGSTMEVPGVIARSMFTTRDGDVMPQLGSSIVDHRTPLSERWGGFFVTGNYVAPVYGGFGHMGNVTTAVHPTSGPVTTSNEVLIEWQNSHTETRGYSSKESDIAGLMIFDHQMRAMNLLTRLNWETRVAMGEGRADFSAGPLRGLLDDVVDYFLFTDEVAPPARLMPRPAFAQSLLAAGPKDRRGRSLRELDLERRLFRYPLSYMIYTAAFDGLPSTAKDAVYRRLHSVLSSDATDSRHSHLSAADRRAVIEILRETKSDLPAWF